MISIDEQMAPKKNWGQMPFPKRMDALEKHTAQRTIRSDKDIPVAAKAKVRSGDNYSELAISPSGRHQAPVRFIYNWVNTARNAKVSPITIHQQAR